jgi:hypothetical protein
MPLVWAGLYAPDDWRKPSTVLFDGAQTGVLGCGAPLDHASGSGEPSIGRIVEGISGKRARCERGISSQGEPLA